MAIIPKKTKVYVSAVSPIKLLEGGDAGLEYKVPNNLGYVKDYYGDIAQAQQELEFQPASFIGVTTGKTAVVDGILYYQIGLSNLVDKRTANKVVSGWTAAIPVIGWGLALSGAEKAGTYEKIPWFGWASSADITDNESFALEQFNKRTDNATLADVKKANANSNAKVEISGTGNTATGNTDTGNTGTTSTTTKVIWGLLAAIVVGIGGFIIYKKTRN